MTTGGARHRSPILAALIVAAALFVGHLNGLSAVVRPGYTPDEEITAAVVPSISTHIIPTLPSGVLYIRGLLYVYFSWLSGLWFGQTLATYRTMSLALGVLAIVLTFRAGQAFNGRLTGALAALLLATFPAYMPVATFARPYTGFLAASAAAMVVCREVVIGRVRGRWFVLTVLAGRFLHEFGGALALLPLAFAVAAPDGTPARSHARRLFMRSIASIAVLEVALFAVTEISLGKQFSAAYEPALRPLRSLILPWSAVLRIAMPFDLAAAGLVMAVVGVWLIRTRRAPVVAVCCAVCGFLFQLGLIATLVGLAALAVPRRAGRYVFIGAACSVASAVCWIFLAAKASGAVMNWSFVSSLLQSSIAFPLSGIFHIASAIPLVIAAAAVGSLSAGFGDRADVVGWERRALGIWTVLSIVGLILTGLTIQPRFVLLTYGPVAILAALGIESAARFLRGASPRHGSVMATIGMLAAAALLVADQRDYGGDMEMPRSVPALSFDRPVNTVICSEELACLYLVGRVDWLLLTTDDDLAHYTGLRQGQPYGVYANTPVLASERALDDLVRERAASTRLAVVVADSGKVASDHYVAMVQRVAARHRGRIQMDGGLLVTYFEPGASDREGAAVPAATDATLRPPRSD